MIATSPLQMVQTYRTNHDFYRVSAVQRIPAGKANTIRQAVPFPFEQTAYSQYAHSVASRLSNFIQSTQGVKQSAQAFLTGGTASAMNQRTTVSSKPESVKGEARTGATLQSYRVGLRDIASV